MKYFIANWKAHKNIKDSENWANELNILLKKDKKLNQKLEKGETKIIICPPYPLLILLKETLLKLPNIHIGSQDISSFDAGSYTGEVTGKTLEGIAEYAIIGHSERRQYLRESDEDVEKKVALSLDYNITPILCVRDTKDTILESVKIVAYEPPEYIGTGKTQALSKILEMRSKLKLPKNCIFIYGAGVTENSVTEYLSSEEIDGLLMGSASLDPRRFYDIISRI